MRPHLRVANVGDDELFLDDVPETNFAPATFAKYALRPMDILLNAGLLSAQPMLVPALSSQQWVIEQLEAARELRTTLAEDLTQTRNLMQRTLSALLQGPGTSADTARPRKPTTGG